MPFANPAWSGRAFAFGNALTRRRCGSAAAVIETQITEKAKNARRRVMNGSANDLDPGLLQDAAHAAGELVIELGQLRGVLVAVLELVVGEEFVPGLGLRKLVE